MQTITTPTPETVKAEGEDGQPVASAADALLHLQRQSLDAARGYATMTEKAEDDFRPVALQFRDLHQRQAAELARIMQDRGLQPDPDGTLMGQVHRAVVTVRSLVSRIDASAMDEIRKGEEWTLQAFDDAIATLGDAAEVARLHEMRAELAETLAKAPGGAERQLGGETP